MHTQWTETRAVSNRGRYEVAKRIAEIEAALPFAILGFDTDNGGEFLNFSTGICSTISPAAGTRWALPVPESIAKTTTRVSSKRNWTHVRQLVGYAGLEDPRAAESLNELYAKESGWFRNFAR